MSIRLFFISIVVFVFMGCSKTVVVLLDSGKRQNAIIVSTNKGSSKIDNIGSYVELSSKNEAPTEIKTMSKSEIESRFSDVQKVSPKKAKNYILYFKLNSIKLTDESEKVLTDALKAMKERTPCMVDIIGHTDTTDSNRKNVIVSLKRARYVANIIRKRDIKVVSLTAKGYGEEDLLVKTADNIAEPKNRNVEIFIK